MNAALMEEKNSYTDKVYGAVSFRQADSTTGTYDYTVHVSCLLHAAPTHAAV